MEVRCGTGPTAAKRYLFTSRGGEVIHADHFTTIAHAGANVVVASEGAPEPVCGMGQAGMDVSPRGEALRAAGTHVLGPADATATADVCHLGGR